MNNINPLIEEIQKVAIFVDDITSDIDKQNRNKVVKVTYTYNGNTYTTKPLYYKEISDLENVKNINQLHNYFGDQVYWLDLEKHKWPKGSGESDLNTLVINDICDSENIDFKDLLLFLANNDQTGLIQKITKDGRPGQYYHNLENNNHWHDLLLWIQATIDSRGTTPEKKYFQHLIFNWDKGKRTSLNSGNAYKIVKDLEHNIKKAQPNSLKKNIINLLLFKKQIILQGPPGTGKTREAELIAKEILDLKDVKDLENNEQFNIIQFHPSYSYEDFVRGIMAKPNNDSKGIIYETENKIFAEFAARAHANYEDSQKDSETISKEFSLKELFENFKGEIQDGIEANNGYFSLTDNVGLITSFDEDAFRYKGTADGWLKGGNRMLFKDITKAFSDGNSTRQDIKQNPSLSGLARQHASYFVRVLNLFQKYVDENQVESTEMTQVPLKNFVFIIDEINRANLSSVLGELIYALEYRGKSLDGMYKVDGNNKIILPPNLYIIGTMNTADRSVGHIDYAIRRRFAFADVLPKDLTNELEKDQFYTDLFKRVQLLFIKEDYENRSDYLESDFDPKDVALGHSYFIDQSQDGGDINMRWQYEIKPILLEYVRDGILKESALNEIMEIEKSLA